MRFDILYGFDILSFWSAEGTKTFSTPVLSMTQGVFVCYFSHLEKSPWRHRAHFLIINVCPLTDSLPNCLRMCNLGDCSCLIPSYVAIYSFFFCSRLQQSHLKAYANRVQNWCVGKSTSPFGVVRPTFFLGLVCSRRILNWHWVVSTLFVVLVDVLQHSKHVHSDKETVVVSEWRENTSRCISDMKPQQLVVSNFLTWKPWIQTKQAF